MLGLMWRGLETWSLWITVLVLDPTMSNMLNVNGKE